MSKKRRMPAHIVLPNGMWRFVKSGTKKAVSKVKSVRVKKRRTGGFSMARRSKRSRRSSGFGGKGLMSGVIKPKGIIASMLIGAGTATLAENSGITNAIPYGKYVAGFGTAGVGGVAGVFARDMIKGQLGKSSISGNY